jgi:hypothetical protein
MMGKLRQRTLLGLIGPGVATAGIVACGVEYRDTEDIGYTSEAITETKTFREGVSGYVGTTDTYIRQASATTNYGTNTACHVDGDDGSGADKSCLIRWALTGIPSDAVVTSATITLRALDAGGTYQLYQLNRTFNEGQATWNIAATGTPWATAGALGAADRGPTVGSVSGSAGSKTVALNSAGIAMVQGWITGANHGVIIANSSTTDGMDLASSEHGTQSYRPQLSLTYTTNVGSGGTGGTGGSTGGTGGSTGGTGGNTGGTGGSGGSTGGTGGGGGTAGGGASGGSAGSGGVPGGTPEANVLIAFIGDQGNSGNSDAVLNLIEAEGAQAVMHNGDFDYANNPTAFEDRVNAALGANFPYYAVIGNHDASAWGGSNGYSSKLVARVGRLPAMNCAGEIGVKANCNFKGVHLIESCIGVSELRSTCNANAADQVSFIQSSLAASTAPFKICNWHKNQNDMQTGSKTNEVGWQAYQACINAGAIVATGHEHSYERTRILTAVGSGNHGVTGPFDTMNTLPGQSFVFVSGLGGVDIRDFEASGHSDDTWWATTYASNRWYKNGALQPSTSASYGALFIRFHDGGNIKRAVAYFKDLNGRLIDEFTINVP